MTGRLGWSPIAHLMWAIAFLSVFAALRVTSQRTDSSARDDGRIILAAALVLNVIVSTPKSAAIGLGIVALGLPAYLVWARKRRLPEAPALAPGKAKPTGEA